MVMPFNHVQSLNLVTCLRKYISSSVLSQLLMTLAIWLILNSPANVWGRFTLWVKSALGFWRAGGSSNAEDERAVCRWSESGLSVACTHRIYTALMCSSQRGRCNLLWVEMNPDPPQEVVATHLCPDYTLGQDSKHWAAPNPGWEAEPQVPLLNALMNVLEMTMTMEAIWTK